MKFEPIEVINNPFYFGIGGIGDFLLLMATFYDDIQPNTDVIFVANNVNAIRSVSDQFPLVNKFWLYPNQAFLKTPEMWRLITRNNLCKGTGVTPCEFRYVEDWIECGKTNVFDYYGVKRNPEWAKSLGEKNHVCVQPCGGADDKTKIKVISYQELSYIFVNHRDEGTMVYLIGSEKDRQNCYPDSDWIIDFADCFREIRSCKEFYSCDTWGKTLAGLAGKKTTIFPNQYLQPIQSIFNHPVDPSDYVFLKDWGFKYADGRSF